jgi:hypothetical protein
MARNFVPSAGSVPGRISVTSLRKYPPLEEGKARMKQQRIDVLTLSDSVAELSESRVEQALLSSLAR